MTGLPKIGLSDPLKLYPLGMCDRWRASHGWQQPIPHWRMMTCVNWRPLKQNPPEKEGG